MVAANKGAVLASDAWSQLNPEQEHALKRALNDAADGVWVLCIVLHFTKTNQADVVFEDLSSSAVATADAEVTTVHPRGDGAGPVADVQLSIDAATPGRHVVLLLAVAHKAKLVLPL